MIARRSTILNTLSNSGRRPGSLVRHLDRSDWVDLRADPILSGGPIHGPHSRPLAFSLRRRRLGGKAEGGPDAFTPVVLR